MIGVSLLRILLTRSFAPFRFVRETGPLPEIADLDGLGLYVHIPFCRTICGFCPYCKETYRKDRAEAYCESLLAEISLAGESILEKKEVSSLYFGGGTPALMIDAIPRILERLDRYFVIKGGIGIELHPDDVTAETLSKLRRAGITMVSLGIQSFDKTSLEALGRIWQPFEETVRQAAGAGFEAVDVDLIFAMPGQTTDSLCRDLMTAFSCGATQVSVYPFIDFSFARNKVGPLPEKTKARMLHALARTAKERGLERTSVWTFARKGTPRYSSVTRDLFLGFGVSAVTLLKDRFQINTFSVDAYAQRIREKRLPTALTLRFTIRQRAAYFLFWNAYTLLIPGGRFETLLGLRPERLFPVELMLARIGGILQKKGKDYRLTERGTALYHKTEQIYTAAYIDRMWNQLRKEPFPARMILK